MKRILPLLLTAIMLFSSALAEETPAPSAPQKVVYVNCDCSTMARDVKILEENGYKLRKASAFDMFPRTSHVESCAVLYRE